MHGEILLYDTPDINLNIFEYFASPVGYGLSILVDDNHLFENQMKNKEEFVKIIQSFIDEYKYNIYDLPEFEETRKQSIDELTYLLNNFSNLLKECDYVRFKFENIDEYKFIQDHQYLLNKKIVLNEVISLTDEKKINNLLDKYKDIKDKIYVSLEGNLDYASLEECKKTIETIKLIANDVKKLNLSVMEQIMYVYDLVRNRVYTKEDERDFKSTSRDLSKVLLGDKIVCMGYSNIFNAILNYLNIICNNVTLKSLNNGGGHARNIVYVKDDKYNIDGVYYFDATWDCKKIENDNSYLNSYKYFAKTKKYMDKYNEKDGYVDEAFEFYEENMVNCVDEFNKDINPIKNMKYVRSINYMNRIINGKDLIDFAKLVTHKLIYLDTDFETLQKQYIDLYHKFDKEISGEVMLQVLNNVRKIQNIMDEEWYSYTLNDLFEVLINSNWHLKGFDNSAIKMLYAIFGEDISDVAIDIKAEAARKYFIESNIAREVKGVELTKILKKELNRKKNK